MVLGFDLGGAVAGCWGAGQGRYPLTDFAAFTAALRGFLTGNEPGAALSIA